MTNGKLSGLTANRKQFGLAGNFCKTSGETYISFIDGPVLEDS